MEKLKQASNLLDKYAENLSEIEKNWPHDIKKALKCINANIFEPGFSIKTMREQCNIKDQNFSSRFNNYIGHTPRSYINFHRVKAVKLLLNKENLKDIPVHSLGFLVGFEKPSSFSMAFKKKTGYTPKDWKHLYH